MRDGLVNYSDDLKPLMVDIDSVRQHPENYNNGDVEKIVESIEQVGMYRPIYVQRSTGHIFAGNHTWEACKLLGATQVPVVFSEIDDVTAKRFMVGDNELARLARPDSHALLRMLDDLADSEAGLVGTGYDDESLDRFRLHLEEIDQGTLGAFGGEQPEALSNPHQCPGCGQRWQGGCRPDPDTVDLME